MVATDEGLVLKKYDDFNRLSGSAAWLVELMGASRDNSDADEPVRGAKAVHYLNLGFISFDFQPAVFALI